MKSIIALLPLILTVSETHAADKFVCVFDYEYDETRDTKILEKNLTEEIVRKDSNLRVVEIKFKIPNRNVQMTGKYYPDLEDIVLSLYDATKGVSQTAAGTLSRGAGLAYYYGKPITPGFSSGKLPRPLYTYSNCYLVKNAGGQQ